MLTFSKMTSQQQPVNQWLTNGIYKTPFVIVKGHETWFVPCFLVSVSAWFLFYWSIKHALYNVGEIWRRLELLKQLLFCSFGKFAGLRDMGHDEKYLWDLRSNSADVCRRWRKAMLGFTFTVGLAVKNICKICALKSPICELKFPLGRQCRKALVRATIEHALGEILREWELLKQIYGYVPLAWRDFNFAYFHAEPTQRPHGS